MDHPNSHCCPTSWDQRIPNEPLFERNFLVERPPIIPQDFPKNTNQCTPTNIANRPWLVMDRKAEKEAMMYWHYNIVNKDVKGTNTRERKSKSLKKMTEKHPDRPWLHTIRRNIDKDSQLSNRNYYNPRDCIIPCVQHDLAGFARIADEALMRQMSTGNKRLDCSTRTWNQPTSLKMTEPVDFDYGEHLRSCKHLTESESESE